jgi:hypothetical protein
MKRALGAIAVVLTVVGCGSLPVGVPVPPVTAGTSPAPVASPIAGQVSPPPSPGMSPSTAPSASGPVYGVLVDLLSSTSYYTLSLVGVDARPWAAIRFGQRTPIPTASAHAIVLPYVSSTLTSVYALDGDSVIAAVRLPDGRQDRVMQLPVGNGQEGTFAVSPDDRVIAYTVLDFNRSPVHVALYTDSLGGGNRKLIYESDSNYVWPVAWHGGLIVLAHAYGPYEESIVKAAPGRDNPYAAISYHLIDPVTAKRVVLMGACTVSGPLSPAGSACIQGGTIDWHGNVTSWGTNNWGSTSSAASVSPSGDYVAAATPGQSNVGLWQPTGALLAYDIVGPGPRDWAGWLDDEHALVASGAYSLGFQMRVITVPPPGQSTPTIMGTAYGFYAARLPTDIV